MSKFKKVLISIVAVIGVFSVLGALTSKDSPTDEDDTSGTTSITTTVDMSEEDKPSEDESKTTTTAAEKDETPPTTEQELVYVTPSGEKYHNKYCRYYNEDCKEMTAEDAEKAGYDACAVCGG